MVRLRSPGKIGGRIKYKDVIRGDNKYIPIIAEYFTKNEPEFNIVSDEAFRLSASLSINILILSLRLLIKPNDRITKLALMKAYISSQNDDYDECYFIHEDSENILPYEFTNEIANLQEMPLYELVERLLDIFKLKEIKGQSARKMRNTHFRS